MSGDGITAQTTDLRTAAPQYSATQEQVEDVVKTLIATLNEKGACWGNDAQGQTFAGKYLPPALAAIDQMDRSGEALGAIVLGIGRWAQSYQQADDASVGGAEQLQQAMPNYTAIDNASQG